jgi:hypothetical protein
MRGLGTLRPVVDALVDRVQRPSALFSIVSEGSSAASDHAHNPGAAQGNFGPFAVGSGSTEITAATIRSEPAL